MTEVRRRPSVKVLCGIGAGASKRKETLTIFYLDDGQILEAVRYDEEDDVMEAALATTFDMNGERCFIVPCRKHGVLYVLDRDIRAELKGASIGKPATFVAKHRLPKFRVAR